MDKRVSPLNNPPSEKAVVINTGKSTVQDYDDDKGKRGGVQRGRERVSPVEAVVRCQMCATIQKVVFAGGRPPDWHRCIGCKELQPMDGFPVTMYGLYLPRVRTPEEVRVRAEQNDRG